MEILDVKTHIGLIREKNEDSVLAVTHNKNKSIKMLLVADGMGGREHGEIAAGYVTESLEKWFQSKDVKDLNNTDHIAELLTRYVKTLNNNLVKKYGVDKLGTTLTLALVNKKNTILLNVGDSRGYIYKDKMI